MGIATSAILTATAKRRAVNIMLRRKESEAYREMLERAAAGKGRGCKARDGGLVGL